MEVGKRGRRVDGRAEEQQKRMRVDGEGEAEEKKAKEDDRTAEEDEKMEEFFAILRRIQVAAKYFEKNRGGGRDRRGSDSWSPKFKWEDFEGISSSSNGVTLHEAVTESIGSGFDLNADPETNK